MAFFLNIRGVKKALGACRVACLLLLITSLAGSSQAFAQLSMIASKDEATEPLVEAEPVEPDVFSDSLNRQTPRSSAVHFLLTAENGDFETAARYLDIRNLPRPARDMLASELAEQLYVVISRALWIDIETLSEDANGTSGDGLPSYRDLFGEIPVGNEMIRLLMQRVPAEVDGQFIWKISNATVGQIPRMYEAYAYVEWVEDFRQAFPSKSSFLGVESYKWTLLLLTLIVVWPVLWLISVGVSRLISGPASGFYPEVRKLLTRPLPLLVLYFVVTWMLRELGVGATAQKILQAHTVSTIITVWALFCVIDLVRAIRRERFKAMGRDDASVLGRPLANALKLLVALLAALAWLSNVGVDISALLAGLGVGGIAMALALQKPIEDLFGALTLYSQRPIGTGDLCRYGQHFGRVEEIGLRSTRIRTQSNTVVSVPNSRLAYEDIENISARRSIWYRPLLRLRIDTTPEQIRAIVDHIRALLMEDSRVLNNVLRVQFRQFGEYSLDVKVHAYIDTTDFTKYLEIAEELNYRILEMVHEAGAALALPDRGQLGRE